MRWGASCMACILCLCLFAACADKEAQYMLVDQGAGLLVDEGHGYSVQFPSSWEFVDASPEIESARALKAYPTPYTWVNIQYVSYEGGFAEMIAQQQKRLEEDRASMSRLTGKPVAGDAVEMEEFAAGEFSAYRFRKITSWSGSLGRSGITWVVFFPVSGETCALISMYADESEQDVIVPFFDALDTLQRLV